MIADINGPSGQINAVAEDNLRIGNTQGNLTLGAIVAGGTADIIAEGGIDAGDKLGNGAQVTATDIILTAKDGSIGSAEKALDVDTNALNGGSLNADAANGSIWIRA